MKNKYILSLFSVILFSTVAVAQPGQFKKSTLALYDIPRVERSAIKTPYPSKFEISQILSAELEQERLKQLFQKFDHTLTPYYIDSGKVVVVKFKTKTVATDGAIPQLVIGTPSRTGDKRKEYNLKEGDNQIKAEKGGMIYFRYVTQSLKGSPTGKIEITFDPKSEHQRTPYYIKGVTGHEEFKAMLQQYQTRDVLLASDKAAVVVSSNAAKKYSQNDNKEVWFAALEKVLEIEDYICGIDDNDPNPVHHSMAKGIRHLMVEVNRFYAPMFATKWATGYNGDSSHVRLLSVHHMMKNNWGVSHELGHQHQLMAITPSNLVETTVNIYSLAVQRGFYDNYTRAKARDWQRLHENYFSLPIDGRSYFDNSGPLRTAVGNMDFSRLMMMEQLYFIFGEELFRRFHRIVREEGIKVTRLPNADDQKKYYFVWKACQITGYDLRDYFKEWGYFQTISNEKKALIDKNIKAAGLQLPPAGLHMITGENYKDNPKLPLALLGIKTSKPDKL